MTIVDKCKRTIRSLIQGLVNCYTWLNHFFVVDTSTGSGYVRPEESSANLRISMGWLCACRCCGFSRHKRNLTHIPCTLLPDYSLKCLSAASCAKNSQQVSTTFYDDIPWVLELTFKRQTNTHEFVTK